jgi:hypothetical protein
VACSAIEAARLGDDGAAAARAEDGPAVEAEPVTLSAAAAAGACDCQI